MTKNFIITAILALVMLGAVIYGFVETGSPLEMRQQKMDETRLTNLRNLQYAIENYTNTNNQLPSTLDEVFSKSSNSYYANSRKDPETNVEYEYKKLDSSNFKLCATFSTASKNQTNQNYYTTDILSTHPKGYYCFDIKATSLKTPPPAYYLYTPTPTSTNSALIRY